MKSRSRLILIAIVSLLVLGAPVSSAYASPPTDDPGGVSTEGACSPGWYYTPTSRGSDTFSKVGSTHSNFNGTSAPAQMTLSATTSGAVSATVSGSTNIGLSVKVASVSTTYGISATTSLAVTIGNSITITVPAYRTGNGDYGAWRAYVVGTERYYTGTCAVTQTRSTTVYTPYKKGWNTWIS